MGKPRNSGGASSVFVLAIVGDVDVVDVVAVGDHVHDARKSEKQTDFYYSRKDFVTDSRNFAR